MDGEAQSVSENSLREYNAFSKAFKAMEDIEARRGSFDDSMTLTLPLCMKEIKKYLMQQITAFANENDKSPPEAATGPLKLYLPAALPAPKCDCIRLEH